MEKTDIQAMVKTLQEKGYNVELEPTPNDDEIIKTLKEHGYKITKSETKSNDNGKEQTKTETDIIKVMETYGFKPIGDKEGSKGNETQKDNEKENESKTESETKTETVDREQAKSNIMFMLGTPNQTHNEKADISDETVKVMTADEIQERMPELRQYVIDNGGIL